jgi:DNA repair protein RadC
MSKKNLFSEVEAQFSNYTREDLVALLCSETKILLRGPQDTLRNLRELVTDWGQEHFLCAVINGKNFLLDCFIVSMGSVSSAPIPIPIMFRKIFRVPAGVSFIVAHNHPTGDCTPSDQDIKLMRHLREVGELLQFPLTDFVIMASDGKEKSIMHEYPR